MGDVDPLLGNVEKLAICYGLTLSELLEADFSGSGTDRDGESGWRMSLAGLTPNQKSLLISLADEFAETNSKA